MHGPFLHIEFKLDDGNILWIDTKEAGIVELLLRAQSAAGRSVN
jgi:hypothetical protein